MGKKKKKKKYTESLDEWYPSHNYETRTTFAFRKRLLNGDLNKLGVMKIRIVNIDGDCVELELSVCDAETGEPMTTMDTIRVKKYESVYLGDMVNMFEVKLAEQ